MRLSALDHAPTHGHDTSRRSPSFFSDPSSRSPTQLLNWCSQAVHVELS
jgi:hypothetical protein